MNDSNITPDVIKHIADLAMISLTDEEITKYQKQIAAILEYVTKLSEVKTEDIEYKSHVDLVNVVREDKAADSLSQDSATQNRKETTKQGYFTISAVLPNNE